MNSGMDSRKALQKARLLGCFVTGVRGTGEIRIGHPNVTGTIKINARRHDAPRALTVFLRRIEG